MGSFNKVILMGNVGKDPDHRVTENSSVVNFSLATQEYGGKGKESKTEWHRIVAWGKVADVVAEYVGKGSSVLIEGRLQTREWEDKEGNKRYTTEIVASSIQFLSKKGSAGATTSEGNEAQQSEDNCPF